LPDEMMMKLEQSWGIVFPLDVAIVVTHVKWSHKEAAAPPRMTQKKVKSFLGWKCICINKDPKKLTERTSDDKKRK